MEISEVLKQGAAVLGIRDNALLSCEVMLADVLGVEREYLVAHRDEEVTSELFQLFKQYVGRVEAGEPVAYIIGNKEFYGLDFYVDKRVLVPRPETEHLVDKVLEFVKERGIESPKILDVGTGSGNIAIAIAKNLDLKN